LGQLKFEQSKLAWTNI